MATAIHEVLLKILSEKRVMKNYGTHTVRMKGKTTIISHDSKSFLCQPSINNIYKQLQEDLDKMKVEKE